MATLIEGMEVTKKLQKLFSSFTVWFTCINGFIKDDFVDVDIFSYLRPTQIILNGLILGCIEMMQTSNSFHAVLNFHQFYIILNIR